MKLVDPQRSKLTPEVVELISLRYLLTHSEGDIDIDSLLKKSKDGNKNFTWERLVQDISAVTGKELSVMSVRRHFGSLKTGSTPSGKAKSAYMKYLGCPDDEDHFRQMSIADVHKCLFAAIGNPRIKVEAFNFGSRIGRLLMPTHRDNYGDVERYIFADDVMVCENVIVDCDGYAQPFFFYKLSGQTFFIKHSPSQTLVTGATVEIPFFFKGECLRGLAIKLNGQVQQDYYIGAHRVSRIRIYGEVPQNVLNKMRRS